ncbi:translation factor Sua5 [Methyloceanibacter marginalis]|uniref:Threonylcarbamoyl-AMP synthase n=1 Tax=Methyloceanibacter marginalis TaxID=1774971 RepID=A0A1E3W6Z7_9HYPH|nr:L-threonylcarbamoyladenylate synthase [Methyloceanibacter marginalis]ODS01605.1 translation factor Sua5 [Methyloceanibacter marginalis]
MPVLPATEEAISQAAQALARGEIVAFPTETVYGLGADARDARAVTKVFAAKDRPRFNPLIVHVPDIAAAETYAPFDDTARKLAEAFWPGPLSLVLPKRPASGIADLVTAGLDTMALRAPNHAIAQALLKQRSCPSLRPPPTGPGGISPTDATHVAAELGDLPAMILDGGPCARGLESTVVRVTGETPALLRLGAVPRQEIEAVLGHPIALADEDAPIASPGQLVRHYAPNTPLRLDATEVEPDEALLAFGPSAPQGALTTINLSAAADLAEAATKLFASLRALDQSGASRIAVMPVPDQGLGEAINDRLRRAAKAR